jgi:hypothetical protein
MEIYQAQQERLKSIPEGDEAAIEAEIVEPARRSKHLVQIMRATGPDP